MNKFRISKIKTMTEQLNEVMEWLKEYDDNIEPVYTESGFTFYFFGGKYTVVFCDEYGSALFNRFSTIMVFSDGGGSGFEITTQEGMDKFLYHCIDRYAESTPF